jgi:hypothetical protein
VSLGKELLLSARRFGPWGVGQEGGVQCQLNLRCGVLAFATLPSLFHVGSGRPKRVLVRIVMLRGRFIRTIYVCDTFDLNQDECDDESRKCTRHVGKSGKYFHPFCD